LNSDNEDVKARATLACASLDAPSSKLLDTLYSLTKESDVAIHVFGICVGKANDEIYTSKLISGMETALAANNAPAIVAWLNAVGNAGPSAVSFLQINPSAFTHANPIIRLSAVYALRKFVDDKQAKDLLRQVYENDENTSVQKTCSQIFPEVTFEGSDYPFNKSFAKDLTIGGKITEVVFSGELFAGTNFNCKQPTFNYEGLAQVQATGTLFGESKQAFLAKAIYGKDNQQPLADVLQLTVWGDVIYQKNIPRVDCSVHTYPLFHSAPGFSVSYTLWVSVVPVVFSASMSLGLGLSWGWQVCDGDLSAMVELIPTGTLTADGSVTVDLLLLRAGFELSASFNERVTPQLYIHGSECQVGFDVEQYSTPMTAKFDSFFMWRECKFLFFDCHWGTHNEHVWWGWSLPVQQHTLFNQAYKITP